ncbi:MAG TPA: TCP-1/cpn60 chaperonin family protein [Stenomitos sp.]
MSIPRRIVKTGPGAREALIKGANAVADAVKRTLGPFVANAALEKGNRITNDGVSIASEIYLDDEIENRGATIIKETCRKANDMVGDGTTSAITLAQAILNSISRSLANSKTILGKKTPAEIIKQIETERKEVTERLLAMKKDITTEKELIDSARVSVENDELAELIGKTQFKLGKDGVIIADETALPESSVEIVSGVQFDNGFGSSISITNSEKQTAEFDDIPVFMTNYTLETLAPIIPALEQLAKNGAKKVILLSRGYTTESIRECMNNSQNGFLIVPINAPYVDQSNILRDIQAVIGGRFIDHDESPLDSVQSSDFGFAKKFIASRYSSSVTGKGDLQEKERVAKRVEELEKAHSGEPSDFMKRAYKARIAQLTNGFAMLKIGATSETERKYKKDKADDAVNAVRVAYQEGVVPGAGLAFKEISEGLPDTYLLKKPLLCIYEQIMSSAPSDFKIEDWVKDPVKVLRVVLDQACSVASVLASAEIVVTTKNPDPLQDVLARAKGAESQE